MILLAATDSGGKAGPIGLLVVLALCVASYFLFRSMTNQMKKVPPSFDEPATTTPAPDAPASTDATDAAVTTDEAVDSGDDRA